MFADFINQLTVLGAVDAHHLAGAAQRHLRLVGADVGREYAVVLVADFDDALARGHAPEDDLAGLAGVTAARQ